MSDAPVPRFRLPLWRALRCGAPLLLAALGLSACGVALPGGVGALLLALLVAAMIFRPPAGPCAREAHAESRRPRDAAQEQRPADTSGEGARPKDAKQQEGPVGPCLSIGACLCSCELAPPSDPDADAPQPTSPRPAAAPELEQERTQVQQRVARHLPADLRRRLG